MTKGAAEIAGVPAAARRLYSKRRAAIEAELGRTGSSGERAAQAASLKTRKAKDHNLRLEDLVEQWRHEAARAGINQLTTVPSARRPTLPTDAELAHAMTLDAATFDRPALVAALAASCPLGAARGAINDRADSFLAGPHAVALDDGGRRWTTAEILDLERTAIDAALRRRTAGSGAVPSSDVDDLLANRPSLSDEQREMVRSLCTSGDGVHLVIGAPGSGKTFALGAARAAWRRHGHEVIGCALAARAAAGLEADSGIPSQTIARLLHDLDGGRRALTERTVVVCDEAAMVGTRDLARLVAATATAGAKLVLVGDPKQLPPIEAGGLYPALARRLGAVELVDNRRQRDPGERAAVAELRDGRAAEAIARLDRIGRISTDTDPDRLLDRMVSHWATARDTGTKTVMLALTRDTVAELNRRARTQLVDSGRLGEVVARIEDTGSEFATGDVVLCLRNNPKVGVRNGDLGTVTGATGDGLLVETKQGQVALPASYLADGHLAHGYALTVHKSQGATYDMALLHGDHHLYAEAGYTALTRGKKRNHAYVLVDEGTQLTPEEQLRRRLDRAAATPAAVDAPSLGR